MSITDFSQIKFNSRYHRYWYGGRELTSVSKTLGRIKSPFDAPAVAQRVADRDGRPVEAVLAEWDLKRQTGLARGTQVHQYIERVLHGEIVAKSDPVLDLNQALPEIEAFDQFWQRLRGAIAPQVEQIEWIVGDAALGIAGTLDALLLDTNRGTLHLFDWKTGGKFRVDNQWQRLLPPFDDLDDCELVNYSLQVSLYRLMIERNTDLELESGYIVHLGDDGAYQTFEALDFGGRLLAWLGGGRDVNNSG